MQPYRIETAYGSGGETWAMAGKLHIGKTGPARAARSREEKTHGNEESEENQQAGSQEIEQETPFDRDQFVDDPYRPV